MEITGTQAIAAPRSSVWAALNDPAVLKRCLPGCESVERSSPDEFKVVVAAAIGPLRARFNGTLRIAEADPPKACVMVFEGQGGPVGFGKGTSTVTLSETPAGTELAYSAKAQVGGKLAQVGSRLIDSVAKKMSDDFFTALREQLAPTPAPRAEPGVPTPAPATVTTPGPTSAPTPAPAASAAPAARMPADAPTATLAARPGVTLVPGWWLAVAAAVGAAAAIAGAVLVR
jgi:carbon monoxide dehydrogenase subunit G